PPTRTVLTFNLLTVDTAIPEPGGLIFIVAVSTYMFPAGAKLIKLDSEIYAPISSYLFQVTGSVRRSERSWWSWVCLYGLLDMYICILPRFELPLTISGLQTRMLIFRFCQSDFIQFYML
ncbi:Unknown protein, partial [Striga hermonthica]